MNQDQQRISAHRQFFAEVVTALVRPPAPGLTAAFLDTPRERFVGPGPWDAFVGGAYVRTPLNDPAFLYQDVAVRLRDQINNGQPSLHAVCIASLRVAGGERVIHIGAGTGYYTAVLARLVGPSGRVVAYELESDLAERAVHNLADFPNVEVRSESAVGPTLTEADIIYVNAGATHPVREWLSALRPLGRLLFPLMSQGPGAMLHITRGNALPFAAKFVCGAMFIACVGARDETKAAALFSAFSRGDAARVRSLQLDSPPDGTTWYAGDRWWLSTREVVDQSAEGNNLPHRF